MPPSLKKVSSPRASPDLIAKLLEKHIGASRDERHCSEAIASLTKIKDLDLKKHIQAHVNILQPFSSEAEKIQCIILAIRAHRQPTTK
jgi:hypothetical protein